MFDNLPTPTRDALPELLRTTVRIRGKNYLAREIPVAELLSVVLLPNTGLPPETENQIRKIMANNPELLPNKIDHMAKADFRAFVRQMVDGQRENINASLDRLATSGETDKEYQKAVLDWARFAYGTEQKVDVNVEVEEKRSFMKQISKQYGFSDAIPTEFEDIPELDKRARAKSSLPDLPGHTKVFDQPIPNTAPEPVKVPVEDDEEEEQANEMATNSHQPTPEPTDQPPY